MIAWVVGRKASLWQRLKCHHFWNKEHMTMGWPEPHYLWKCEKCGREQERPCYNDPINPIKETAWQKYERECRERGPEYVMSPPIIESSELKKETS